MIAELEKQKAQLEKQIKEQKELSKKKRMPTVYKGETYQTVADLHRDHFDLKIPYNRFYGALYKNPHLSIEDAVATVRVRQKTLETLKKKKKLYIASYLEGDCLDNGEYGIELIACLEGDFFRITKNLETNKIKIESSEEYECDDSLDDLTRLEKKDLTKLARASEALK